MARKLNRCGGVMIATKIDAMTFNQDGAHE